MEKFKPGIKQEKKCLVGSAAGILFSILGIIMYIVTALNTKGSISPLILASSILGVLISVISVLVIDMDGILSILSAAVLLFSALMFVSSQADNIGYAAAGIADIGYGIKPTLVAGVLFYLIAVVGECIAVFGGRKETEDKKTDDKKTEEKKH